MNHRRDRRLLCFSAFMAYAVSCGGNGASFDDTNQDGPDFGPTSDAGFPVTGGMGGEGGFGGFGGFGAFGGFGGEFPISGGAGGSRCALQTGGAGGSACGFDAFCEAPEGTCGATLSPFILSSGGAPGSLPVPPEPDPGLEGQCTVVPKQCDSVFAPVCGCDGFTYANDCERRLVGVSKLADGACATDLPTFVGENEICGSVSGVFQVCADNLFCEFPNATCPGPKANGRCRRAPSTCLPVDAPVCGCDGMTYGNDCERRRARTSLATPGACGPGGANVGEACGGVVATLCKPGLVCDPAPNQCNLERTAGTCRQQTNGCTKEFLPVCGCDGRTYANDCMRFAAGIALAQEGACQSTLWLTPGLWGGPHVSLTVNDPKLGGDFKFDCGLAVVTSPLEIEKDGRFAWTGLYTLQTASMPRQASFTGQVNSGGTQMKLTVHVAGGSPTTLDLTLGTPGQFSSCL
ncbi:MAG: hypothetical protein KA712_04895 [Myxococcales bacterium]|nr:hypothetical protein [Myxococcales bacterium]